MMHLKRSSCGAILLLLASSFCAELATAVNAETKVSINRGQWHINGRPTHPRSPAEGLLMNVRMVNAVFEDRDKPDFNAEANTERFIAAIPDYVAHGVDAFTVCLQGGMPGTKKRGRVQ